jgi:hypothetical protein
VRALTADDHSVLPADAEQVAHFHASLGAERQLLLDGIVHRRPPIERDVACQ